MKSSTRLTLTVANATGTRFCNHCTIVRKVGKGGKVIFSGQWICDVCVERRKKALRELKRRIKG